MVRGTCGGVAGLLSRDVCTQKRPGPDLIAMTETEVPDPSAAMNLLRDLALSGLASLVPTARPVSVPGDLSALAPWVADLPRAGAVDRAAARRIDRAWQHTTPGLTDPVVLSVAAGAFPAPRLARYIDRLMRRPDPARRRAVPLSPLLPALASAAFADLGFRATVAGAIRRSLETRVLFVPGGPGVASLSLPVLLMLAASHASVMGRRQSGRAPSAVASALRGAARDAAGTPCWAGFWDRWLLHLADLAGLDRPPGFARLPILPSGMTGAAPSGTEPPPADPRLPDGWKTDAPAWAQALVAGIP